MLLQLNIHKNNKKTTNRNTQTQSINVQKTKINISPKKDINMTKRHVKRLSTSLIIKRMQIKTTMRYHLTPVRMGNVQKSTNNKCWKGCGEDRTLLHCWWECKLVQSLWRRVWRFLKELKIDLPCDPAVPLLGMSRKDRCTLVFIARVFTTTKTWKPLKYLVDR